MNLAAFLFSAVPVLVNLFAKKYMDDDKAVTLSELEGDHGLPRIKSYDFIIVGGGTAGCVVAGRLSERFNVLLLEAGGIPVPHSHVPFTHFTDSVALDPNTNYFYRSVVQKNMSLADGGIVILDTGKMLGGSGSHNEMCHQRGSPKDWDNYATLTGDASWKYENVLPLFKKSENFIGQLIQPEQSDYYGKGGPLTVDSYLPPFFTKWAEAATELGFPVADPMALQIPSFAPIEKMIGNGGRVSTYTGMIRPFEENRANLTVIKYSTVTQVLINSANRAYGVTYLRHGIPQIAHASKEVVLSAGAINSPLILMMSGIGPRADLEAAGILVKVDSPVGQSMNDHIVLFPFEFKFNASATQYIPEIQEDEIEAAIMEYLETGQGEFGELQAGPQAFFASSRAISEGEGDWADGRIWIDTTCPMAAMFGEKTKACLAAELQRPKSMGSLKLNATAYLKGSTDFVELADIDFNGYSVPSDLDVMIEAIELVFKVAEGTKAMQSLGMEYMRKPLAECDHFSFKSREYWACFAQQLSVTAIHMVGTCSMGTSPLTSVTDSKLRVHGVTGLRVADASILPLVPNANLNGPVILVGEKAAQEISNDW